MAHQNLGMAFKPDLVLNAAKEVHETKNTLEAVKLLQTGNWVIIRGLIQGDEIKWMLIRYQ